MLCYKVHALHHEEAALLDRASHSLHSHSSCRRLSLTSIQIALLIHYTRSANLSKMQFFALASLLSLASAAPAASALLETRAQVLSDTIDWPTSSHANGNIAYQYKIIPGSGTEYTIDFFNSAAANSGSVYTYKAAGVGDGADGTSVSKTLSAGTSASLTIQKSGTQVQITIDN